MVVVVRATLRVFAIQIRARAGCMQTKTNPAA